MLKFFLLLATHAVVFGCGVAYRDQVVAFFKRKSSDAVAEIKAEGVKAVDAAKAEVADVVKKV
jgi:hypothetical protein